MSRNGLRAVRRGSPPGADDGRRERDTEMTVCLVDKDVKPKMLEHVLRVFAFPISGGVYVKYEDLSEETYGTEYRVASVDAD